MSLDLNYFREQRQYRQKKRKQFITRYERIRQIQNQIPNPISKAVQSSPPLSKQYEQLFQQNIEFRQQLSELNKLGDNEIITLKNRLTSQKDEYKRQIQQLIVLEQEEKMSKKQKIESMFKQIKATIGKNKELRSANIQIEQYLLQDPAQQLKEIKNEYISREQQLQTRLLESEKLVNDFENQFKDENVITKALQNEELIKAMIHQGQQQFKQTLLTQQSVKQILQQKNQLMILLHQNAKSKEEEMNKMDQLADACKETHRSLSEQNKKLIEANSKMAGQLLKIKEIFEHLISQKQNDQEQDEDDDLEVDQDNKQEQQQ